MTRTIPTRSRSHAPVKRRKTSTFSQKMTEEEHAIVDRCISYIVERFRISPHVFLTEDDVRVHLARKLLSHFDTEEWTRDGDRSISLHTETRWYGDGTLKLRSDIVLIDVRTLDVLRHSQMPSKGYGFNFPKGVIEIKFRRPNGKSDRKWISDIERDIDKLERLQPVFRDAGSPVQTSFWVLALDKKRCISQAIRTSGTVNTIYEHSNQSEQDGADQPTAAPNPNPEGDPEPRRVLEGGSR